MTRRWFLVTPLVVAMLVFSAQAMAKPGKKGAKAKKAEVIELPVDNLKQRTPKEIKALVAAVKKVNGVKSARAMKKKGTLKVRHRSANKQEIENAIADWQDALVQPDEEEAEFDD